MTYKIKLNSLYLCVENMERAIRFYEEFLQQRSSDPEKGLFIVNGIRLCMYDYGKFNDTVLFSNSCLPRFETQNIDSAVKKLEKLNAKIILPPTNMHDCTILKFEDSEGNMIEVYSR